TNQVRTTTHQEDKSCVVLGGGLGVKLVTHSQNLTKPQEDGFSLAIAVAVERLNGVAMSCQKQSCGCRFSVSIRNAKSGI
ncbi:hypothetical protein KCA24_31785, partial [Escherichia coli]|nr:hypothetical protein [Escherichia coli]